MHPGNLVKANDTTSLVVIQQIVPVYVSFSVPEGVLGDVRKYAAGEFGPQSQALLNELAKAMLCLTDSQRKSDYDASMGRVRKEIGKRLAFEQILLSRHLLKPEQLNKVREFASAVGLDSRDALLQQKMITPEAVMQAYAESVGLPYIDLGETGIDESLVLQIPAAVARNYSCVPVMIDEGQMLVASPNPLNKSEAKRS